MQQANLEGIIYTLSAKHCVAAATLGFSKMSRTWLMGKDLARSTPGRVPAGTGAPVFRHGSAASDDVHAILNAVPGISRLVGHSKGALAIENALRSLQAPRAETISVITLGCVIAEEFPQARYEQYLGWLDALGGLNSWNRTPEHRPFTHHSTNTAIPLSMQVASSVTESQQKARVVKPPSSGNG